MKRNILLMISSMILSLMAFSYARVVVQKDPINKGVYDVIRYQNVEILNHEEFAGITYISKKSLLSSIVSENAQLQESINEYQQLNAMNAN